MYSDSMYSAEIFLVTRQMMALQLRLLRFVKGKSVPLQARGAQRIPGS